MDDREQRGLVIAATKPIRQRGVNWYVPSPTGNGTYKVEPEPDRTIGEWLCECPDFQLRAKPCKHVHAVTFTMQRETVTITDDVVVTETETTSVRLTYGQDWTNYNKAQCAEGDLFGPMLKDLCSTIAQPEQKGPGRPRMPLSDMAYNCVGRVYSGLSARRFDSDVREAHEDGMTDSDAHYNTTLKYLRDPKMTPILIGLVGLSAAPLAEVESSFAADSTGFTTSRFERWYDHKWGKERSRHEWVKLHAMCGTKTNVVTSVQLSDGHANDTRFLPALVADTAERFTMDKVTADKAYSSKNNMQVIEDAGAAAYIPFKGGWPTLQLEMMPELHPETSVFYRMKHMFIYQREMFLQHYHCRSNVETTFSMIKRKFGDSLRSKSEVGQYNEILCKVVAHNICVLIACMFEMGLPMPEFAAAE
jgi:transposase